MKTVPFVDVEGYFVEDILVLGDQPYTGISLHYKVDVDPAVRGYTVGYAVPAGLYKPRLDIETLKAEFGDEPKEWPQEREGEENSRYWIEGLTPEEIDGLNKPQLTPFDEYRQNNEEEKATMWDFILGGA